MFSAVSSMWATYLTHFSYQQVEIMLVPMPQDYFDNNISHG